MGRMWVLLNMGMVMMKSAGLKTMGTFNDPCLGFTVGNPTHSPNLGMDSPVRGGWLLSCSRLMADVAAISDDQGVTKSLKA